MKKHCYFLLLLIIIAATVDAGENDEKSKYPPWLGLAFTWQELPREDSRILQVQSVSEGGPAEAAGVRPGDLIIAVNARQVDFGDDLDFLLFLSEFAPGETLHLKVVREGETIPLDVELGVPPKEARPGWRAGLEYARARRAAETSPKGDSQ